MNDAKKVSPPPSGFRLTRYFVVGSLAAFLLITGPLIYLERMRDDFLHLLLAEQDAFFVSVQDRFAKLYKTTGERNMLAVHEGGSVNLTQLFANTLWQKVFAPLVVKTQRIPIDHCRAIADVEVVAGKAVPPPEKKACYAEIGARILALPEFRGIDARVIEAMKKSSVFKIKVYDLRGITVYSSDHRQIGEDKSGNSGWRSAAAGTPASGLTHRDKFSAFEGEVENRDLVETYVPAAAPGSDQIVGVFEIYSDVTAFFDNIKRSTAQIESASAEDHTQWERGIKAIQAKADEFSNWLLALALGLLALLYTALLLIVRNGQRIIDRERADRLLAERALAESEARFRSLTDMSSDFYWETDAEHRLAVRSASKTEAEGSVFHRTSPVGMRRWEIPYNTPDAAGWGRHRATLDAHLPFRNFEISRNGDDEIERFISISGDPVFGDDGAFLGYRGVGSDITARKRAEADLRIAATAFEAQEGMVVTDADNVILRVNSAFTEITGFSAEEAVGRTPRLLRSGRHDASFYRAMWESILSSGTWKGEIWNRRKSGELYAEWLTITAVRDREGSITNFVATLTDITGRKAAEEEIRNLAFYDPLTQLPNRRLLMDRLHQALASSDRSRHRGALLFIDLDHFKVLNDTLGHDKGDLLLQQVAQRLTACVRAADTVARLGGDEFVVMLEDLSENETEARAQTGTIAEKILATFNQPHLLADHQHQSSGSIGIAPFCGYEQTATNLLKCADIAMYQAKAAGRNAMRFYEPGMQAVAA